MQRHDKSGWRDPGQNLALKNYLHSWRSENYLIAGRGLGKTAGACKKAEIAAIMSPGIIVMITEQTNADIHDILVPCWKEIVTPNIWEKISSQKGVNILFKNGSQVWFRSRAAKNRQEDPPFRGPTVGMVIHDELALDRREDVLDISQMMLRQKGTKFLCLDVITTPKPNWLYRHIMSLGLAGPVDWETNSGIAQISDCNNFAVFYGRTKHNKFNRGLDERMRAKLCGQDAAQELDGLWVLKEGKCWNFVEKNWPHGNLIDSPFDPELPSVLGVDLGGANSAWGVYQLEKHRNPYTGRFQELLVAKAEWTPSGKKPYLVIQEVRDFLSKSKYQNPISIKMGADYNTPGTTGHTAFHMFSEIGWNNVHMITGWDAAKDVQDRQASYLIEDSTGVRRFCVSNQFQSFYPGKSRGLLDMLRHDTYPDAGTTRDYFRKEKSSGLFHEDSRDQWLYTVIGVYPPQFGRTNRAVA